MWFGLSFGVRVSVRVRLRLLVRVRVGVRVAAHGWMWLTRPAGLPRLENLAGEAGPAAIGEHTK